MKIEIDVARILDDLPFATSEIPGHMASLGLEPVTPKAVWAWRARRRIPSERLAELMYISSTYGVVIDINQYLLIEPGAIHEAA